MERKWKIICCALFFTLILLTCSLQYVVWKKSHLTCSAVIYHAEHYGSDEFTYLSVNKISKAPDSVINMINGRAYSNEKMHILNRTVTFSYSQVKGSPGKFLLKVTDVRKSGADNVHDEEINKYMSFISTEVERTMSLTRLPSGDILFTSALGPFFVCDVDGDH
ncbi:hypothetical protein HV213_23810 [Klebsiella sp. RHBSTW-00484]|uniref:FidL-like protein n=1 Tax=unclassified Klebsiella TaxID=2608929 RepID=UPI0015E54AE5|nr:MULTISPECIES: FidL-like protein [unclassified Klebsiella]MBA7843256.1 hypothetical protein [Klebsiella sp. RHBSTW-00465]QLO38628.1 hypothetical protein HV213_23810 [Klebsiella sp. RHBSTW-00484]QLT78148.1 hypothetical protein HV204_23810 [Klebsiella sp. RHBSTW-00464]